MTISAANSHRRPGLFAAAWLAWLATALLAAAAAAQDGLEELPPPAAAEPAAPSPVQRQVADVVRERHASGTVAVERHVTLDDDQNFVNHGPYASFDEAGAKAMTGQYRMGQRHGLWTRWHRGHDAPVLQEPPYTRFQPPFTSQATFRDGKLHGPWTIYDGSQQKISEINFVEGERSGPAVWWRANGGKMRELSFVANRLQGTATFYRPNGQVVRTERYEQGRRIERLTQKYPEGQKYCVGTYRHPQIVMTAPDQWESTQFATFELQGEGTKEGDWIVYYPNGQRQMAGAYERDQPVGQFTWWHTTGQRASVGRYEDGRKVGQWTWWHPNGMKRSQGRFRDDAAFGAWASWDADGTLVEEIDALQSSEAIVSAPREELPSPAGGDGDEASDSLEELPPNPEMMEDAMQRYFLPARLQAEPGN